MGDRLTQLQDLVDQFATEFLASYHYVANHHGFESLGPNDKIADKKPDDIPLDTIAPEDFEAGQVRRARHLVIKEQQIEYLISILPGLENSERDQERTIKELEEELKVAEAERLAAIKEKDEVLKKLDDVIRNTRRPW